MAPPRPKRPSGLVPIRAAPRCSSMRWFPCACSSSREGSFITRPRRPATSPPGRPTTPGRPCCTPRTCGIAGQASMCGSTVSDAAALGGFGTLVQQLWRRWPAASPRADRFRAYIGVMYWHAFSLLATGRPLADLYFQHCLRLLADAWTGAGAEDGLIDRIRHAVQGDPDAADAA